MGFFRGKQMKESSIKEWLKSEAIRNRQMDKEKVK